MGSPVKWTERFGFSDEPQATSEVLFAALAQGRISESDYFAWAQEIYQLPLVTADFFAIPADGHFWNRVKDVHAWSPNLFPLADWNGVLLIACVEPPAGLNFNFPHQFVLATARNLQLHWGNLNPEPIRQVGSGTPVAATPVAAKPAVAKAPAEKASPPPPPAAPVEELISEPTFDAGTFTGELADMSSDLPDGVLPSLALHGIAAGEAKPEPIPPREFDPMMDMPEGIKNMQMHEELPPVPVTPEGLSQQVSAAFAPIKVGFGPKTTPVATPVAAPAAAPVAAPVSTPPPIAAPVAAVEMIENRDFVSEPSITVTMTNSPDPYWVLPVDPISLERCTNMDDLNLHTLSTICRHFTGGLIFLKDGADGLLKPGRFTQPFRTPRKPFGGLQLEEPSIFRIVDRTSLPYHGYVTPAKENDRFFKAFLGSMAPTHITVVPILQNKEIIGLLVGIADSNKPFRHILPIMETLAAHFAKAYQRLGPKVAAA